MKVQQEQHKKGTKTAKNAPKPPKMAQKRSSYHFPDQNSIKLHFGQVLHPFPRFFPGFFLAKFLFFGQKFRLPGFPGSSSVFPGSSSVFPRFFPEFFRIFPIFPIFPDFSRFLLNFPEFSKIFLYLPNFQVFEAQSSILMRNFQVFLVVFRLLEFWSVCFCLFTIFLLDFRLHTHVPRDFLQVSSCVLAPVLRCRISWSVGGLAVLLLPRVIRTFRGVWQAQTG